MCESHGQWYIATGHAFNVISLQDAITKVDQRVDSVEMREAPENVITKEQVEEICAKYKSQMYQEHLKTQQHIDLSAEISKVREDVRDLLEAMSESITREQVETVCEKTVKDKLEALPMMAEVDREIKKSAWWHADLQDRPF